MTLEFVIGPEIIRAYRRLPYKAWYAIAEFVDNSTQSYFDNRDPLDEVLLEEDLRFEVSITYDRPTGTLRIVDNAMGMDVDRLQDALKLGYPPEDTSGRSEYGMGLKTAACWFGDEWSVTTKKLNDEDEYKVTVDVDRIAAGDLSLDPEVVTRPPRQHYTIVEIRRLHRALNGWAIRNTKEYLSSMYRVDLREETVDLKFDNATLAPRPVFNDESFLKRLDGSKYVTDVVLQIGEKRVTGWMGVLAPGTASRRLAGFSVIRRGRVIAGWLNSWRPEEIFGPGGRNDLLNQRLTGELHLDQFDVSHTKDAILFQEDEEEELVKALQDIANGADLIHVARTHRGDDIIAPSPAEKAAAIEELRRQMSSPEFVDAIDLQEVPPPELEDTRSAPMINETEAVAPEISVTIGDQLKVRIYLLALSSNDPYYAFELGEDGWLLVIINAGHPGYLELRGAEAVLTYFKHCAFDAIAEWKCRKKVGEVLPESVRQIKDELFRTSAMQVDDG